MEAFKIEKSEKQTGVKRKRILALEDEGKSTKVSKNSTQADQLSRKVVEENLPVGWKEEIKGNVEICVAGLQALAEPGVGIISQSSSQVEVEVGENNPEIGDKESKLNDDNLPRSGESESKDAIRNTTTRRNDGKTKHKEKNTVSQNNYIVNLYGLSAWWERVSKPGKSLKFPAVQEHQTNQHAKVSFLTNFCRPEKREKGSNLGNVKFSTTPKRPREESLHLNGESSQRKHQKNRGGIPTFNIQARNALDQAEKIVGGRPRLC